jgi:choline dehydrogenase-like flavoprotein
MESEIVGHTISASIDGAVRSPIRERARAAHARRRPPGFYVARYRNLDKRSDFLRGYGFEGGSGTGMIPGAAYTTPGFGEEYKKHVRDYAGATISMGAFGEVLARYENYVGIDPQVKDAFGIPVKASAIGLEKTSGRWFAWR